MQAHWVLDRYEVVDKSTRTNYSRDANGEQVMTLIINRNGSNYQQPGYDNGGETQVTAESSLQFSAVDTIYASETATLRLSVTPVFKWLGDEEPSTEITYREAGGITTYRGHSSYDGEGGGSVYGPGNPYQGAFFTVDVKMPEPWAEKRATSFIRPVNIPITPITVPGYR